MTPPSGRRPRLLAVFPTGWDRRGLAACAPRWRDRYRVLFARPYDDECEWDFDAAGFVERAVSGGLLVEELGPRRAGAPATGAPEGAVRSTAAFDGVFSSSDYPGATVAAAIATRLGLPGPHPEAVLRCSHKYYSRLAQREAVPEAAAEFRLVRPDEPLPTDLDFPCFVKPVKGAFSIMSGRVDSLDELAAFLERPAVREFLEYYVHIFNRLVRAHTDFEVDGRAFLAEEFLPGRQATLEGFAVGDEPRVLGVVDSVFHPMVASFSRFDFPSALPADVQRRMGEIARRTVHHLGLRDTMFNLELNWNPDNDRVHIIEVNPRMAGQFADLYEKVLGMNSYEIALALAAGDAPPELPPWDALDPSGGAPRPGGRFRVAASVPLRTWEPCRVVRAPTPARIADVEARFPGTLVWTECAAGQELSSFEAEDGRSIRYAVVNLGAESRAALEDKLRAVEEALGYEFEPLRP